MAYRILVVAATDAEAGIIKNIPGILRGPAAFNYASCEIIPLVAGVGGMETAWAMTKWFSSNPKPDFALNIGIAGSYNADFGIGEVVVPVSDCFADSGIESPDGFATLGEAGLVNPDRFPFKGGCIFVKNCYSDLALSFLKPASAITVNCATGTLETREKLVIKFNPDIETMEGATFFYICSGEKLPFLALRGISNIVEARNKAGWNITLALQNLTERLEEFLKKI
jgi:futalosine hydrolase